MFHHERVKVAGRCWRDERLGRLSDENPARVWRTYQREVGRGLGNPPWCKETGPLWKGSACETLWARQRFLGSVRDFALVGLVLMLHPLQPPPALGKPSSKSGDRRGGKPDE
jgi:hypothetical protein